MNIELTIAIISGIVLPIVFFVLPKLRNKEKKYLLEKFLENKNKLHVFIFDLEKLMENDDSGNRKAFKDSSMTIKEFYDLSIEQFNKEYSEEQYQALRKAKLSKLRIKEFIEKLKAQEDNLNLLIPQIKYLNSKYEV